MAMNPLIARFGLTLGLLGSSSDLALAAPLANGDVGPASHTDADRIGVWFDRAAGDEGVVVNVLGTDVLGVRVDRVDFGVPALLPASTADAAPLNLPHGLTPTAPNDGDLWSTNLGFFGQVNGVTVSLGTSGGGIGGTIADGQVAVGTGADTIGGDDSFFWTAGTGLTVDAVHTTMFVLDPAESYTTTTGRLIIDNLDGNTLKWYNGTEWVSAGSSLVNFAVDISGFVLTLDADLTQDTRYRLAAPTSENAVILSVDGMFPLSDGVVQVSSGEVIISNALSAIDYVEFASSFGSGLPGSIYYDGSVFNVIDSTTTFSLKPVACANDFDSGPFDGLLQLSTIAGDFAIEPGLIWNSPVLEIPGDVECGTLRLVPSEGLSPGSAGYVAFDNTDSKLYYNNGSDWLEIAVGAGLANIASAVTGETLTIEATLTGPQTATFGDFTGTVAVVPIADINNEYPLMWNVSAQAALPSLSIYNFNNLEFVASPDPGTPNAGYMYFDDSSFYLRYYTGSEWIDLTAQAVTSVNGQTGDVVISPPGNSGELIFNDNGDWGASNYLTTVVGASHGEITLSLDFLNGSSPTINLDGYSGPGYDLAGRLIFKNNSTDMWAFWPNNVATGSDVGYDFRLRAYGDSGVWEADVLTIARERGGAMVILRPLTVSVDNSANSGFGLIDTGMSIIYEMQGLPSLSGAGFRIDSLLSGGAAANGLAGAQISVSSTPDCSAIQGLTIDTLCSGSCDSSSGITIGSLAVGTTTTWGINIVPDVLSFLGAGVVSNDTGAYYIGLPNTEGTWRFVRNADDLLIQRYESGVYGTKQTILA